MTKQQITINGKRYLVVNGTEVFVRIGRVWSGGLTETEAREVQESVR